MWRRGDIAAMNICHTPTSHFLDVTSPPPPRMDIYKKIHMNLKILRVYVKSFIFTWIIVHPLSWSFS